LNHPESPQALDDAQGTVNQGHPGMGPAHAVQQLVQMGPVGLEYILPVYQTSCKRECRVYLSKDCRPVFEGGISRCRPWCRAAFARKWALTGAVMNKNNVISTS
jgi:hypothetical protein